jgi:tyrosinase
MMDIAGLWPEQQDRQRYQKAAYNFRIPYWDWAANLTVNGTLFPYSVGGNSSVTVDGPNGVQTIANPLYTYQFKPLDKPDFLELDPVSSQLLFMTGTF